MADFHFESIVKLHESIEKISLENIASVTFNAEALKTNFEVIVQILKSLTLATNQNQKNTDQNSKDIKDLKDLLERLGDKQEKDKNDLSDRIDNNDNKIKSLNDQTDKNTEDIEKLKDALSKLKQAQDEQKKSHDDLKNDHNALDKAHKDTQDDLEKLKEKVAEHDRQIDDILRRLGSINNNSGSNENLEKYENRAPQFDSSHLEREIAKLNSFYLNLESNTKDMKKKFEGEIADIHQLFDDYVKKDDFNTYKDQTNNKLQSHQDSIDELYKLIKDLEAKISDKLNCEFFDKHVDDYLIIKDIVIKLANGDKNVAVPTTQVVQGEGGLSTKFKAFIEALMSKFPDLEERVKKIEKGLNDHLLVYKTFADDTNKKIANSEENLKNTKAELNKKIAELEALIKALKDQLANLNLNVKVEKAAPIQITNNNNNNAPIDNAEIRRLQVSLSNAIDRITGAEGQIADLQKLKERVARLEDSSDNHEQRITALEEKFEKLKARLDSLELLIKDIKSSGNRGNSPVNNVSGNDINYDKVKQMIDDEINKLRDELLALIDALRAELAKKADSDDLDKLEGSILKKLDEIVGILMARIQNDKGDTKKALIYIEKKMNEISKVILGDQSGNGGDKAILATMPWNPWACASCNSKPKEFPGALIDYKYWSKVPKRDTSPSRLTQGKFGKGWPREQNNKRVSSYVDRKQFAQTADGFGAGLPEIHKSGEKVKNNEI